MGGLEREPLLQQRPCVSIKRIDDTEDDKSRHELLRKQPPFIHDEAFGAGELQNNGSR